MNISSKAIAFWEFQKQIEIEYQKIELKKRSSELQQMEKSFNEKMLESANQISQFKHKLSTMKYLLCLTISSNWYKRGNGK
jgi:hypothetical protein